MKSKVLKISIIFFTLLSIIPTQSYAHSPSSEGSVKGRIINELQKPMDMTSISIKGTHIGGYTNKNGEFELKNIVPGKHILAIHGVAVRYKEQIIEIIANEQIDLHDIIVDNSYDLNEVVVIAKSESRKKQEQAYAVGVVDVQKAYATAASLSKLLNTLSSVRIREDGGVGSNYNFSLNGFSGNQVKFFLDGIPMDNFGSSFDLSNISANMSSRIEIYKGVLPVSLGADALGGAVNIVTRKDANYLDASYSIGSFNTHKLSLNGAYTDVKSGFTVRLNAFANYSDNNYKVYAPIKDLSTGKMCENQWVKRFHDNYQSSAIRLETGIVNKSYADYLLAGVILSQNDKDVQTGITMESVYGEIKAKSQSYIPTIRYKKDDLLVDGLSLSLYGTYNIVNSDVTDTTSRKYNWLGQWIDSGKKGEYSNTDLKMKNREWQANGNLNYVINKQQSITFNHVLKSFERKTHDKVNPDDPSNDIPQNLTKNISGLGWQIKYDKWNTNVFTKWYNLNSSTYKVVDRFTQNQRLEKLTTDKTNWGYGAAFTYFVLPQLQAKASYELAYRLPESNEIFGDGLNQKENPDLKPESSNNINLGMMYEKQMKEHTLFLETNFIFRDSKDFIFKRVSSSDPTAPYVNLGKVLTKGVEGGVKYRWKNMLNAGFNMTYQHIIDNQKTADKSESSISTSNKNIRYKKRLPNIPYLFGSGNIGLNFKNIGMQKTEFTIDYYANYSKEYYLAFPGLGRPSSKNIIPQQLSHDIALGYTIHKGRNSRYAGYGISMECTNLANERLYDNFMLQKPGRAFNIKFRYFLK